MEKHYSLVVADKVLTTMRSVLKKNNVKSRDWTISCWSNGREQGYSVINYYNNFNNSRRVNFAQQRNSDDILVIYGGGADFDISTNQPNDNVWDKRIHFPFNKVQNAAKFIVDFLKQE